MKYESGFNAIYLVFIILVAIVALALAYNFGYLNNLLPSTNTTQTTKQVADATNSPSPSPLVPAISVPSGVKVVAINSKADGSNSPDYSFQLPNPQNENADGLSGAPDGYRSHEVSSWATEDGKNTDRDWMIQYVTVKDGAQLSGTTDWFVLNDNFFSQLSSVSIGKTTSITSFLDKKSYSFTRDADITIDGVTSQVYDSNYVAQFGKQSKYAVFKKDGYTYLLAVEWNSSQDDYIFNLVTASFLFSLRPDSQVVH